MEAGDSVAITEEDLTTSRVQPLQDITSAPFDPAQSREQMRGWIALALVGLLIFVAIYPLAVGSYFAVSCGGGTPCQDNSASFKFLIDVFDKLLAPLIGLVGSVIGFYFGEKAGSSEKNRH